MSRQLKGSELIIVLVLIVMTILFGYYYANPIERNKIFIKLYPIQAYFEKSAIQCSDHSPEWLRETILEATITHQAPNNQIVYINPKGQLFHCENGYLGFPLFSKRVDRDTRFRYASVSKLWTSDAILDIVKQKKINLDTPILTVLNSIPTPQDNRIEKITIQDLLLHRGGFNRTGLMGDEMFSGNQPFCPSHLEKLAQVRLSSEPNTIYNYSNLGYCLLGAVIAKENNQTYQQYIQKHDQLKKDNIRFLENRRFEDEAKYRYIETTLTGYGDIYTAFDYPALASSAGLSGSATALAYQVQQMVIKPQPNILTIPNTNCDLTILRDCYGYGMFPYQKNKNSLSVYFRDGTLLGVSSLVVVDEYGGIVTLLSSGQAKKAEQQYDQTKMKIYQRLNQIYH